MLIEALSFRSVVDRFSGRRDALLFDLQASTGPRIGEAPALHESRWWRDGEGNGWLDIEERADGSSKRQLPPKQRTHREVWMPAWLADDLDSLGRQAEGWWSPAPDGGTWPVDP